MPRIIETRRLTPVTKLFRIDAPLIAASAKPGQFVMLRVRDGGERIPITIADYDRDAGTITIVVQEVGATTSGCARSRRATKFSTWRVRWAGISRSRRAATSAAWAAVSARPRCSA